MREVGVTCLPGRFLAEQPQRPELPSIGKLSMMPR
jgi:hypothetical protein